MSLNTHKTAWCNIRIHKHSLFFDNVQAGAAERVPPVLIITFIPSFATILALGCAAAVAVAARMRVVRRGSGVGGMRHGHCSHRMGWRRRGCRVGSCRRGCRSCCWVVGVWRSCCCTMRVASCGLAIATSRVCVGGWRGLAMSISRVGVGKLRLGCPIGCCSRILCSIAG